MKKMRRDLFLHALSFVVYAACVWTALVWYDWKLLVILTLFIWGNNLTQKANNLR